MPSGVVPSRPLCRGLLSRLRGCHSLALPMRCTFREGLGVGVGRNTFEWTNCERGSWVAWVWGRSNGAATSLSNRV